MPTTNTQKIVVQKFFNDLASPVSLTADTWGPTDGHYLIQPYITAPTDTAVEFERISVLFDAAVTSASIVIAIDPAGTGVLWSGTLTLLDKAGDNSRLGFAYPKQIIASADIPAAVQTLLSTTEGKFYVQIKANVTTGVMLAIFDYSLHTSAQPSA